MMLFAKGCLNPAYDFQATPLPSPVEGAEARSVSDYSYLFGGPTPKSAGVWMFKDEPHSETIAIFTILSNDAPQNKACSAMIGPVDPNEFASEMARVFPVELVSEKKDGASRYAIYSMKTADRSWYVTLNYGLSPDDTSIQVTSNVIFK